jgi:multidrug resistance efflux pump
MADAGDVTVRIGADVSSLEAAMNRAKAALEQLSNKAGLTEERLSSLKARVTQAKEEMEKFASKVSISNIGIAAIAAAATAAAYAFTSMVSETLKSADAAGKLAQSAGVSVEEISKLQYIM